jgi:hypothetical protein
MRRRVDDESMLRPFEQLLTMFRQSRAKPLRFAGFLLLVALVQARFIIRSRNRRDDFEADEESEKVMVLKMAADESDGERGH